MTVLALYNVVYLILLVALWTIVIVGLRWVTKKKGTDSHEANSITWLHEAAPYVWLARLILAGIFVLLFIYASYDASFLLFLQGLSIFPLLALIPIQVPMDTLGAFVLHKKGRHYVEQAFSFNFAAIVPYIVLPLFLAHEKLVKRRERLERRRLREFAESLPIWMRVTLARLDRSYGHAKRRAQLNLTRKRSHFLAEKGLAIENRNGELRITALGSLVAGVLVLPKQGRLAGREGVALRTQGGRGPGNPLGVFR